MTTTRRVEKTLIGVIQIFDDYILCPLRVERSIATQALYGKKLIAFSIFDGYICHWWHWRATYSHRSIGISHLENLFTMTIPIVNRFFRIYS